MSANKTVMTLRSPLMDSLAVFCGSGCFSTATGAGGWLAGGLPAIDEPQSAQKALPSGDCELQWGQSKNCGAPQSEQKRLPS